MNLTPCRCGRGPRVHSCPTEGAPSLAFYVSCWPCGLMGNLAVDPYRAVKFWNVARLGAGEPKLHIFNLNTGLFA